MEESAAKSSVRVQRTPFDALFDQHLPHPSHQITVALDTDGLADSVVCVRFPIGEQRGLPEDVVNISLLAKANAELDVAACLRQFYEAPGSPKNGRGGNGQVPSVTFLGSIEIPLSIPAVPPNRAGGAHEAAYAFFILWMEAGPEHKG